MSEPPVEISIVVCTHDRADGLRELVGVLGPQLLGHPVDLIVVDSASGPDQAAEVRALVEVTPQARLVRLDTPGVSIARNAGLRAAAAPWIAFLDDDEVPIPTWVEEARRLVRRLPADCAACGGNTLPLYPAGLNPAMSPRWSAFLSAIRQPGEFDQTAAPHLPIGHSLVRAEAFRQVGGFDPRLGRVRGSLLSGEEVLVIKKLIAANWRIWHSDRIEVGHRIPADRLQRAWARDRAFWEGVTTVRVLQIHDRRQLWLLAVRTAVKRPLLWLAWLVCDDLRELDLRLAFVRGVHKAIVDQGRAGHPAADRPS